MDGIHFDRLTRSLSARTSRRVLTRLSAAGPLSLLLGPHRGETAAAACNRPGRACDRTNPKRTRCCRGARCRKGQCRCPGNRQGCGKRCCSPEQRCANGRCVTVTAVTCPPNQTLCAGRCVDLQTDAEACGSCTNACGSDRVCSAGTCACAGGQTDCAGDCVLLSIDQDNCGACGNQCPGAELCRSGACCIRIGQPCVAVDDRCCGDSVCNVSSGIVGQCCLPGGANCSSNVSCCSGTCRIGGLCASGIPAPQGRNCFGSVRRRGGQRRTR